MLRLEFSSFRMLRFLRIKHLAVIDSVEVEFDPGLNVLTGETGAGKSILVEAVGLLLGRTRVRRPACAPARTPRRSKPSSRAAEKSCSSGARLPRRAGAARFINGTLATAGALKRTLSNRLIELHGQHEHQTLARPASHLESSTLGALEVLLTGTAAAFEALRASQSGLAHARSDGGRRSRIEAGADRSANSASCDRHCPEPEGVLRRTEIGEDLALTRPCVKVSA